MNEERIDELLALAALGELSATEEAELDQALEDDALLVAELNADLATAANLQSIAAEDPPAAQRDAVLDAIAGIEQERGTSPEQAGTDVRSPSAGEIPQVASLDAARERRARRWQPFAAAAAVVAMVLVGAGVLNQADDAPTFAEVTEANDVDVRMLAGTVTGELQAFYSPSADALALDGNGVADVGDDLTYQLWLVDDAGATSIGTFAPDSNGAVMVTFDGLDPTGLVLAVTVEPTGGSDQPTTPIVASA